jgi:hypothetical protein
VPGTVTAAGTLMNKAAILSDAAAAAIAFATGVSLTGDVLLTDVFNALASKLPRLVIGTYAGTGTSGVSNKNVLTFPVTPKFVIVVDSSGQFAVFIYGVLSASYQQYFSLIASWTATTLSWYSTGDFNWHGGAGSPVSNAVAAQMNTSAAVYTYIWGGLI